MALDTGEGSISGVVERRHDGGLVGWLLELGAEEVSLWGVTQNCG
jgi:hypothetical protein